jgi:hypothetical protein
MTLTGKLSPKLNHVEFDFVFITRNANRSTIFKYPLTVPFRRYFGRNAILAGYTIFILVCAMATSHADCRPETALTTIRGPQVSDQSQCGFLGQTTLASTAIAPRDGLEYMKIMCVQPSVPVNRTAG